MNIKQYHRYAPSRIEVAETLSVSSANTVQRMGGYIATALEEGEKKKEKRDILYGTFWEL